VVFLRFCGCFFGAAAFRLAPRWLSAFDSAFFAGALDFEAFGADFTGSGSGSGSSPQYLSYSIISSESPRPVTCTYNCLHNRILALLFPISAFEQASW
jgi:hypothetical protein